MANTKTLELKITITMDEEVLTELFEDNEVKPTKAKIKKVLQLMNDYYEADAQEQMEDALKYFLGNIIQEEWER
jgi:uncharacterized protein YacL (UPF0231 family)